MPDLPETPTVAAIYSHYEGRPDERRTYLGGSRIGEECRRMLWLEFRWAGRAVFEGRILRLFETGHREEERIFVNLRAVGIRVEGTQHAIEEVEGHVRGHLDGVVLGLLESPKTWHVAEVKTMNRRGFDKLVKEGVEKAKPVHFAQMQLYGFKSELTRWVYIVQCKDDDRLYLERGEIKKNFAKELIRKARAIVYTDEAPARIANDPTFWQCKRCNMYAHCWQKRFPDVNCRTCAHAKATDWGDGAWECFRGFTSADKTPGHRNAEDQAKGCEQHIYLPSLLHWLTPKGGDQGHIEYDDFNNTSADGFPTNDKHCATSLELHASTLPT